MDAPVNVQSFGQERECPAFSFSRSGILAFAQLLVQSGTENRTTSTLLGQSVADAGGRNGPAISDAEEENSLVSGRGIDGCNRLV